VEVSLHSNTILPYQCLLTSWRTPRPLLSWRNWCQVTIASCKFVLLHQAGRHDDPGLSNTKSMAQPSLPWCVCYITYLGLARTHTRMAQPSLPWCVGYITYLGLARTVYTQRISRVGQNRIYTPYMAVCMVISLLIIPYVHRIYVFMYGFGQPYICTRLARTVCIHRIWPYTGWFPCQYTIYTPYIWFWPTLHISHIF
jgi:hypothetical protein